MQKKIPKNSNLSLGINVFTGIGYRNLSDHNEFAELIKLRQKSEVPMTNLSIGVLLRFKTSNNIAFEGGLQYSKKGYKTNEITYSYGSVIDDRKGFESNSFPIKGKLFYSYEYLDIPLRWIYSVGKKEIKFFSSVGLTTGILFRNKVVSSATYNNGNTEKSQEEYTENYKTLNLSPTIGFGITATHWDKVNFSLEPVFQYGLIKTTDTPVTENLWSYGLNFTLYYNIN